MNINEVNTYKALEQNLAQAKCSVYFYFIPGQI